MIGNHYEIDPAYKYEVPGLDLTLDYSWVDGFIRLTQLHDKKERAKETRRQIKRSISTLDDYKKRLKASHTRYVERRRKNVQRYLCRIERSYDPLQSFERNPVWREKIGTFLSWDQIEDALTDIEMPGGISDTEREKHFSAIDQEIAEIESEIDQLNKPEFFQMNDGTVLDDMRYALTRFWQRVQRTCNAPCNPRGFDLKDSPPAEKEAYEKLGIGKYVNSRSPQRPCSGR
jgi:DNA repair exonuclease SbcCD ATPase subunit